MLCYVMLWWTPFVVASDGGGVCSERWCVLCQLDQPARTVTTSSSLIINQTMQHLLALDVDVDIRKCRLRCEDSLC